MQVKTKNPGKIIILKWRYCKKGTIKDRTLDYFDDITKIEDFDIENILLDEKLATMEFCAKV